jgi:hypothetical protein
MTTFIASGPRLNDKAMKFFFRLLIVAAAAGAVFFVFQNKPELQNLEKTTLSEVKKSQHAVSDAVKEGKLKANALATNAAGEVRKGEQKANSFATNAVADVKAAATNVVGQVKKAIGTTNQ